MPRTKLNSVFQQWCQSACVLPYLAVHTHISLCIWHIQNHNLRGLTCWSVCINCLGFSAPYRFISCGGRSLSLTKIKSKINQGQTRGCLIFLFFTSGGACILAKSYFVFLSEDRRPLGWNFTLVESDPDNFPYP